MMTLLLFFVLGTLLGTIGIRLMALWSTAHNTSEPIHRHLS